eukprot:g1594.t1
MICVAYLVNFNVQDPYMDEIFHIPQSQLYCKGEFFTWDPKITTPPGFHLLGLIWSLLSRPVAYFLGTGYCSVGQLRMMNLVMFGVNWIMLGFLKQKLHPGLPLDWCLRWSWVLSLHPVYLFFAFLYYTDISSISFLLVCYLLASHNQPALSAMSGCIAILIRQTNAIWVAFVLMNSLFRFLKLELPSESRGISSSILKEAINALSEVWSKKWNLLQNFWQLVLVLLLFGVFVLVNGGIVVGDQSAHQVAIHEAQIPYLFIFIFGSFLPLFFQVVMHQSLVGQSIVDQCFLVSALVLFGRFLIFGRVLHPYTVADNRHITFYLWRWFLSKIRFVCLLIPIAWISAILTSVLLARHRSHLWILGFYLCAVLTILPSPLFELRYFLPMTFLTALHLPPMQRQGMALVIMGVIYLVVNCFMLYLFLERPYEWSDGTEARFIW